MHANGASQKFRSLLTRSTSERVMLDRLTLSAKSDKVRAWRMKLDNNLEVAASGILQECKRGKGSLLRAQSPLGG